MRVLHGVRAGWPAGGWGIRELCPGQTSLPAALRKNPEVGHVPAPDCRHLQQRHYQVTGTSWDQFWSALQFYPAHAWIERLVVQMLFLCCWTNGGLKAAYFSCCSDDSDDSDGALGRGLSLDPSGQHTALTVKTEPCEQGEGLAEGKPLNGVLLQGKGKTYLNMLMFMLFTYNSGRYHLMFSSLPVNSTDQKADKTSFYNFSKLKKNRKWLKVFLIFSIFLQI